MQVHQEDTSFVTWEWRNGEVQGLKHAVAQPLALRVNPQQGDWDLERTQPKSAHSISVCTATALAPDEVHIGRLPRLPFTIF